nr:unnamed protein product [Digitaria exilis]
MSRMEKEKETETESEVVALARQAAAAARSERAAATRPVPVRRYRGVQKRRNRYCATVWNGTTRKQLWLGSYATPEEAAYAYDAAARRVQGPWAKPNFPDPSSPPPPPPPCQAISTAAAPTLTSLTLALRALQARNNIINHLLLPMPGLQPQPQRQPLLHPCWAPPPPAPPRFVRLPLLPGPAAAGAAAAPNAAGLYRTTFPSIPAGGYVPASLEELRLNWPSSSEESSTAAAAVPKRRRMAVPSAVALEDGAVVGDNFSGDGGGASSSSVASTSGRWW